MTASDSGMSFCEPVFPAQDMRRVIAYLQKEIRHQRRNIGALKLSNLLQPDSFEEDLNISRARLSLPQEPPRHRRLLQDQPRPLHSAKSNAQNSPPSSATSALNCATSADTSQTAQR